MRHLFLVFVVCVSACTSIDVDAARQLAIVGRESAVGAKQVSTASDVELRRALDAEAFFHGFNGSTAVPNTITKELRTARSELLARATVFDQLAALHDAFGDLAGFDADAEFEQALGGLVGAVGEYAKVVGKPINVPAEAKDLVGRIGGMIAAEIKKAKIKAASKLIEDQVGKLADLMSDPLVFEQVVGFRKFLTGSAGTAVDALWLAGVLDAKPLLDDMGRVAGLEGARSTMASASLRRDVRDGLRQVVVERMRAQSDAIEQGYRASVQSLKRLKATHAKLQLGEPLDIGRVREIVGELRAVAALIEKTRPGKT